MAVRQLAMFCTPTAQLAVNGGSQHPFKRKSGGHGPTLADEVEHLLIVTEDPLAGEVVDWGDYARAVLRWAQVRGTVPPRPVKSLRTGRRLAEEFVEWMMGLPAGWVADVPGLSRSAKLKALGNGVVPQQAHLALRILRGRVSRSWQTL